MASFTFKPIKPVDWEKLADFFTNSWHDPYHYGVGACDWDVNFTKWIISRHLFDEDLLFGTYDGNKLIAVLCGCPHDLHLRLEPEGTAVIKAVAVGLLTIERPYRKKGLVHEIMDAFIKHVKERGYDLITSFAMRSWEKVLSAHGFSSIHKDPQFYIKFPSKKSVDRIRKTRGLNRALATLAKLLAGLPEANLPYGKIKDGSVEDTARIVKLLNTYQNRVPLAQVWKAEDLKQVLEAGFAYSKEVEFPVGFYVKLWESDQGKLLGVMIYDIKRIAFKNGVDPVLFTEFFAFDEAVSESDEKKGFLSEILRAVPKEIPVLYVFHPYNDLKAWKSMKFDGDRDNRRLHVLPLTDSGTQILSPKKIKAFLLTYLEI